MCVTRPITYVRGRALKHPSVRATGDVRVALEVGESALDTIALWDYSE